jgi:integrase
MKLPPGVTIKNGRYYRVQGLPNIAGKRQQKWHTLSRVDEGLPALYTALSALDMAVESNDLAGPQITRWLAISLPGLSVTEQRETERMAGTISTAFAEFRLDQIQAKHVSAFLQNWAGKPRTAQRYKSLLSKLMRWAIVQGIRVDNPCSAIRLKTPQRRDVYIADSDFLAIRVNLSPMLRCFVDLCYLTGQRSTDIRLLRWTQIENGVIKFKPSKTANSSGAKVDKPITPEIQEVLDQVKSIMRERARMSPFVIHGFDGSNYQATGLRAAWERAKASARVEHGTIKDLRAKHATDAKRKGYTIEEIQGSLAHEDPSTTKIYLKQRDATVSVVKLTIPKG